MGLIEIVTDPDIRNGKEARIFLEDIRDIAVSLGVSNGRLQEGSMRVDVNVSLKVDGVNGEIVELKNLNGFKNVEKAITSEIKRQKEIVSSGKSVKPETRRYDEAKNETVFMRKKNTKIDYRYFADTTIAPIRISQELVDEALNYKVNKKFKVDFLLPETIDEINNDPYLFKLFAELKEEGLATLKVSNFVLTRVRSEIKRHGSEKLLEIEKDLLSLLRLYDDEEITYKQASIIYKQLLESKNNLDSLLEENGFSNHYDNKELSSIIDEILVKYKIAVQDYKAGKDKALNYLLGQIYKETKNKVDSLKIKDMLLMKLEEK
jgi:aspartyl-tRNA(Asn)/glutamyl-tRNA(Gln) amidotransferase subunit B